MTAFAVAMVTIKNLEKFQEYGSKAGPTFASYGGEVVAKGKLAGVLSGEAEHSLAAIMKFPSMEKLEEWYRSDEYQALIPLREEGCDMVLTKYQSPPAA